MSAHVAKLERTLNDKEYAIANAKEKLAQFDKEIEAIRAETQQDEAQMKQVAEFNQKQDKNVRSIRAEDALDTKLRLEGTVRIVEKRNQVLQREVQGKEKQVKDASKRYSNIKVESEKLKETTGYTADGRMPTTNVEELREKIEKMVMIEADMKREENTARLVIKKKQLLVQKLDDEIKAQKEKENRLCQLYNDIRVMDRDCAEIQGDIEKIKREDKSTDGAMVANQNRPELTVLNNLESDKEYLKSEIRRHQEEKKEMEKISKAQLYRAQQLQARLDTIMVAIQEMKLEKSLEKHIGRNTVVPTSSEDPYDLDRILPENESIPVETYELLHRNNEAMRSIADRKHILMSEKEFAIAAQRVQLEVWSHHLQTTEKQHDVAVRQQAEEAQNLRADFCRQHDELRQELGQLVLQNVQLRNTLQAKKASLAQRSVAE